jgi:hypothetical protein
MQLTVHAVLVPPLKCGLAYAHTGDGRCVVFTGDREAMIELCREVKACNTGTRGPVLVEAEQWRDLQYVGHDDCPAHWPSVA